MSTFGAILGLTLLPFIASVDASASELFPDLTASIQRLRFHDGKISGNLPEISSALPAIPGPASPWYVTQWRREQLLDANSMVTPDLSWKDYRFGMPRFAFQTPDQATRLAIYSSGETAAYTLFEKNGMLVDGGGSNLFLSANVLKNEVKLDVPIKYSVKIRVVEADISYDNPMAKASGAVLATGFSGFRLRLHSNEAKSDTSVFIQVQHVTSRNTAANHVGCHLRQGGGTPQIVYARTFSDEVYLPFKADDMPRKIQYSLNDHIKDLVSHPVKCVAPSGAISLYSWPSDAKLLTNWALTSMFVGLEVQNVDARTRSKDTRPQGTAQLGMQVSDLHVTN